MIRLNWLLVLALAPLGCANTNGVYEGQRQVAVAITDSKARVDALAKTAESAACIGDQQTVKLALADLANGPRHDEIAANCALQFGNAGHWQAAKETARAIKNEALRKDTIAKVGA